MVQCPCRRQLGPDVATGANLIAGAAAEIENETKPCTPKVSGTHTDSALPVMHAVSAEHWRIDTGQLILPVSETGYINYEFSWTQQVVGTLSFHLLGI